MQKISTSYFYIERAIHSLKTALACLIGFVILKTIHLPFDQWLIVTIIVVMSAQISVGSVLQKSYMRFLGTLGGCLIAAITLLLLHDVPWAIAAAVGFSAALFSFIATSDTIWSESGTLGIVTTAVILMAQNPSIYNTVMRTLEISLGILIAALVSQFILPIHARAHLRRTQALTVKELRNYYIAVLTDENKVSSENDLLELDENIIKLLQSQRRLAKEARQEVLGIFNAKFFKRLLWCEKEILRTIDLMHQAHRKFNDQTIIFLNNHLKNVLFNETVVHAFSQIILLIEQKNIKKFNVTIQKFGTLADLPEQAKQVLSVDELMQISIFLFFAKILTRRLREMGFLVKRMRLV